MKYFIAILTVLLSLKLLANQTTFRFHLISEPHSLDPLYINGASGGYLFNNLYRGLFTYQNFKLKPVGANYCKFLQQKKLLCELDPTAKFSNGQPIQVQHYISAFQRIVDPKTKSAHADLLINLKNARSILMGHSPLDSLGISTNKKNQITFEFDQPDPEFLYKLTHPSLTPVFSTSFPSIDQFGELIVTGPYKIKNWTRRSQIVLAPNEYYSKNSSNPNRPEVKIIFVKDDSTALRLYKTGNLDFLRRLSSSNIPVFNHSRDFYQIPVARFDYIGFSPELQAQPKLKQALSLSINYEDLKKLYFSLGMPGCPSLPIEYTGKEICHQFDLPKAKLLFQSLDKKWKDRKYIFAFSKLGGEDNLKGMQFVANQWKKNLGLKVELRPMENKYYLSELQSSPPDIFKKGNGLERPTCSNALELLSEKSNENYIRWNNKTFNILVAQMAQSSTPVKQKKLCQEALSLLMSNYALIPMGRMHFSMLARPEFKNWQPNELNQLDLSHLSVSEH